MHLIYTMLSPTADSPGTLPNTGTPLSRNPATPTAMNELNLSIANQDITSTVGFTAATTVGVLVGLILLLLVLALAVGGLALGMFMSHKRSSRIEVILECTLCESSKPDLSTNKGVLFERRVVTQLRIPFPTPATSTNYSENTQSENQNYCLKFAEPTSKDGSGVDNSCYHDNSLKEYETYDVIDTSGRNIEINIKDTTDTIARKDKSPTVVESTQELEPREVTPLYSHIPKEPPPPIPRKTPELYKALELEVDLKHITNYSASTDSNSREKSPPCCSSNAKATCYNSAENIDYCSNMLGVYSVVEGEVSPEEMYCEVTEKPPSIILTPTLIKSLNNSTSRTNDLNFPPVPKDINTDPDDGINTN